MAKFEITFLGGEECGDVGSTTWGVANVSGGPIKFSIGQPVTIDTEDGNAPRKEFLAHLVAKAKANRFFKVEEKRGPGRPPADKA